MRKLIAAAVVAGLAAVGQADDAKKDEKKAVPAAKIKPAPADAEPAARDGKLQAGDPAPALKADKWLQGTEVAEFKKDHVYVVEFWATWCGPCIVMMPHMSELQAEFKDKVTIIGYTKKDPNNTAEKVAEFVQKRGPKLGYTFAYSDSPDTYDAWMKAAGQNGIPCSFVIDGAGKVAYIGHPMYLDLVLPKVVDKSWNVESGKADLDKADKAFDEVFKAAGGPNAEDGLKAVAAFEKEYPGLSKIPYLLGPKLGLYVKAKKFDELKVMATNLIKKAEKSEDSGTLGTVARALRGPGAKDNKELVALAVKAAESGLKAAGDKDLGALINVAQSYEAAGETAKAKEYAQKAVEASPDERTKGAVKNVLKSLLGEEKKDDK